MGDEVGKLLIIIEGPVFIFTKVEPELGDMGWVRGGMQESADVGLVGCIVAASMGGNFWGEETVNFICFPI